MGVSYLSVHLLEVELLQVKGALASLQRDYEKQYDDLIRVRKELWALREKGKFISSD